MVYVSEQQKPGMEIISQECLKEETYTKNGNLKRVHTVVKSNPFVVKVGCVGGLSFADRKLEAKLFYDGAEKEVDFLKKKPMDFTAHLNQKGEEATIEVRINVLTSQHEGNLFQVAFSVSDDSTNFLLLSYPVKVLSKLITSKGENAKCGEETRVGGVVNKKRSYSSRSVEESLSRIEERQLEFITKNTQQLETLQTLISNASANSSAPIGSPTSSLELQQLNLYTPSNFGDQPAKMVTNSETPDFENAFKAFFTAYKNLPAEERPRKIRKIVDEVEGAGEIDQLSDCVNLFTNYGSSTPLDTDPFLGDFSRIPDVSSDLSSSPEASVERFNFL